MLKITKIEANGHRVILKLEGKITDQWAPLLDSECRAALRERGRVELDCVGVSFLDEKGVEVLKRLLRPEVVLTGAPGYMTELLQSGGRS
ncbi:hypothetical protein FBQ96_02265 [Nitrospirales bacterium NOB]|nr:MAG: hypothetical protein UZ03_NOB001001636 [Nitrospira sp. OLB3]MBV6468929.1 hypothetical protein [Nitrospirota bacterium]MDL1888405.1 hypothetical protein [Nitrospirales bacterium NOB]RIK57063.1 MAG: hypothetical protein DCC63_15425 [Nitrospira sp.]